MITPRAIPKNYSLLADRTRPLTTRIQAIEALRIHLFAFEATLIDELRATTGASWTDIGNLTGVTRQAAQQRWGRYMEQSEAD